MLSITYEQSTDEVVRLTDTINVNLQSIFFSKFCRSKERCAHCGESDHSYQDCSRRKPTDPFYCFCKSSHLFLNERYLLYFLFNWKIAHSIFTK